jgi:beta-lactamase superfamily II metal-dependent hydrolase
MNMGKWILLFIGFLALLALFATSMGFLPSEKEGKQCTVEVVLNGTSVMSVRADAIEFDNKAVKLTTNGSVIYFSCPLKITFDNGTILLVGDVLGKPEAEQNK